MPTPMLTFGPLGIPPIIDMETVAYQKRGTGDHAALVRQARTRFRSYQSNPTARNQRLLEVSLKRTIPWANRYQQFAKGYFERRGVRERDGNHTMPVQVGLRHRDGRPLIAAYSYGSPGRRGNVQNETLLMGVHRPTGMASGMVKDVVAHEYAHHIVNNIVPDMRDAGQSASLEESLADTFAAAMTSDWTIGEAYSNRYDRSMPRSLRRPEVARYYDATKGKVVRAPRHMRSFVRTRNHDVSRYANTGIPNHAAYRIGRKIGTVKMTEIYLHALRHHVKRDASFRDFALATSKSAGKLHGRNSSEQQAVRDGWRALGVLHRP